MPLFDRYFAARHRVKAGLVAAGFLAGAAFACVLTILGKILAEAPPATPGNYAWNAMIFGAAAAVVSPLVTWSALRRAPLWRTIAEPLALAVLGGATGVAVGSALLFLVLPPAGLVLGFARLGRAYPKGPTPFWALPERKPDARG